MTGRRPEPRVTRVVSLFSTVGLAWEVGEWLLTMMEDDEDKMRRGFKPCNMTAGCVAMAGALATEARLEYPKVEERQTDGDGEIVV